MPPELPREMLKVPDNVKIPEKKVERNLMEINRTVASYKEI